MSGLFSDRFRFAKITLLTAALIALCLYSKQVNTRRTAAYFTNIPEGATRVLNHFEIAELADKRMTVRIPDGRFALTVYPVIANARVGDIVNLRVVKKDSELLMLDYELRWLRVLKIWVSIPVLLLAAFMFFRDYRWQTKMWLFLPRTGPATESVAPKQDEGVNHA